MIERGLVQARVKKPDKIDAGRHLIRSRTGSLSEEQRDWKDGRFLREQPNWCFERS
jgi:hypothetical protein